MACVRHKIQFSLYAQGFTAPSLSLSLQEVALPSAFRTCSVQIPESSMLSVWGIIRPTLVFMIACSWQVNIADILTRWTDGELRSTYHRVRSPDQANGESVVRLQLPLILLKQTASALTITAIMIVCSCAHAHVCSQLT